MCWSKVPSISLIFTACFHYCSIIEYVMEFYKITDVIYVLEFVSVLSDEQFFEKTQVLFIFNKKWGLYWITANQNHNHLPFFWCRNPISNVIEISSFIDEMWKQTQIHRQCLISCSFCVENGYIYMFHGIPLKPVICRYLKG